MQCDLSPLAKPRYEVQIFKVKVEEGLKEGHVDEKKGQVIRETRKLGLELRTLIRVFLRDYDPYFGLVYDN